jgi:hypothetical protein
MKVVATMQVEVPVLLDESSALGPDSHKEITLTVFGEVPDDGVSLVRVEDIRDETGRTFALSKENEERAVSALVLAAERRPTRAELEMFGLGGINATTLAVKSFARRAGINPVDARVQLTAAINGGNNGQ